MRRPDPQTLAVDLLARSTCAVQTAAVLFDAHGIFAWGWNHAGPHGRGQHAEAHALGRANPDRLDDASIAVAGRRRKTGTVVPSWPCARCLARLQRAGVRLVYAQARNGDWCSRDVWRLDLYGLAGCGLID